jgi:hypothetical protein
MTLVTLGSRSAKGIKDNTNLNPGNWTIPFTPDIINTNVPQFEVYKMVVKGAAGTTFNVFVDNFLWDVGIYGTLNSWDPQQPLILRPGQSLFFAYSDPITDNTPPSATIWLRYDTALLSGKPVP